LEAEGIALCLLKPFDLDDLLACVAKYVRPPQEQISRVWRKVCQKPLGSLPRACIAHLDQSQLARAARSYRAVYQY